MYVMYVCKDIQYCAVFTFKHVDGEIWGLNPHPYTCGLTQTMSPNTICGPRLIC